jgi:3-isopropylmalate/(R)-2-methylmalate dehydratase small subunit
MIFDGAAHVVGDDIDTDVILPGRYLSLTDPTQLAQHVFEGVDPSFVSRVKPGDILIAGRNFGSGSSREHAPIGLKALGISCVIAASFARIFYRNAINLGLPILISPEAAGAAKPGDQIRVDTDSGVIEVAGRQFHAQPFPPFVQELIAAGGLVPWVRDELTRRT